MRQTRFMARLLSAALLVLLASCSDARTVDTGSETFQVTMQFQTSMDDLLFLSAIDQLTVFLEVPDGGATWPAQGMREVEPGLTTFVAPGNRSFEISLSGDYVRENAVMLAGRNAVSVFLFPDGQDPIEGVDEIDLRARAFQLETDGSLVPIGASETVGLSYPLRTGMGTVQQALVLPCLPMERARCTRP